MKLSICLIQSIITDNKKFNLNHLKDLIPFHKKIDILLLPEYFNCLHNILKIKKYGEKLLKGSETYDFLQNLSLSLPETYIFAGSIPEIDNNKIYNTSTVWNNGTLINKYRKIYSFKFYGKFNESDFISSGNEPVIIETPWCKIGIGLGYDLRFSQLANYYSKNDCKIICYSSNFSKLTGFRHWSILNCARAIDNQVFILNCSSGDNPNAKYNIYGNSLVVDPNGKVKYCTNNNKENVIYGIIDLSKINKMENYLNIRNNNKNIILR